MSAADVCRCSEDCDVQRPVFIAHMRDWLRDHAAEAEVVPT